VSGDVPDEILDDEMFDEVSFEPLHDVVDRSHAPQVAHVDPPWWRIGPSWNRVLIGVLFVLFVYYGVTLIQVMSAGRNHDSPSVDAIVVLGVAQYDGRPSPQLAARLDHVVTLWNDDVASTVVVTGGNQPGDRFTEAEASQIYLVERGVPEDVILMEDEGSTTYESLAAVAELLESSGIGSGGSDTIEVVVVTDPYHVYRSKLTAEEVGLKAHAASTPTSVVTGWTSLRRQVFEAAGVSLGRFVGFDRLSDLTG
jgi:uncharacterized SAM-binding protein YcdF (DUF218 family)